MKTGILLLVAILCLPQGAAAQSQIGQDLDGGQSLSLSSDGTKVAIATPADPLGNTQVVRVYERINNRWLQRGQDISGEGAFVGKWSVSLSADGNRVAIGPNNTTPVFVYAFNGAIWDLMGEPIGTGGSAAVSISGDGNHLVVGPHAAHVDPVEGGAGIIGIRKRDVRTYRWNGNAWTRTDALVLPLGDDNWRDILTGYAMAQNHDGSILATGSFDPTPNRSVDSPGAAFSMNPPQDYNRVNIYEPFQDGEGFNAVPAWRFFPQWSGRPIVDHEYRWISNWKYHNLDLSDSGFRIAIGEGRANWAAGGDDYGFVKIYEYEGPFMGWQQVGRTLNGLSDADEFGYSVSISGNGQRVAIGAPSAEGDRIVNGQVVGAIERSGQVQLFEWSGDDWLRLGIDIDGETVGEENGRSVSLSSDGKTVAIGASGGRGLTRIYAVPEDANTSPPEIPVNPSSQLVVSGGLVKLEVCATGEGPFTYQWQVDGVDIQSANSNEYFIPYAFREDSGDYLCKVSNRWGTTTSAVADISVRGGDEIDSDFQIVPGRFTWAQAAADAQARGGRLALISNLVRAHPLKVKYVSRRLAESSDLYGVAWVADGPYNGNHVWTMVEHQTSLALWREGRTEWPWVRRGGISGHEALRIAQRLNLTIWPSNISPPPGLSLVGRNPEEPARNAYLLEFFPIQLSPASLWASALGEGGGFAVSTNTATTPWTWTANEPWITSGEFMNQIGGKEFRYTIAPNTSASSRSATITLRSGNISQIHSITQDGIDTDRASDAIAEAFSETLSFSFQARDGVTWRAVSLVPWMTIMGSATGVGSGRVNYRVSRNMQQEERLGAIKVNFPYTERYFVDGQEFTDGVNGPQFKIVEGNFTSWDEAREDAAAKGGRLAALDRPGKLEAAYAFMDSIGTWPDLWIGLRNDQGWHWINGNPLEDELWWNAGEPSGDGGEALIHHSGHPNRFSWNDAVSREKRLPSYLIEFPGNNAGRYQIVEGSFTWPQANAHARALGGQLATHFNMSDPQEPNRQFLYSHRFAYGRYGGVHWANDGTWPDLWIGLTGQIGANGREFEWITGEPLSRDSWAGEPDAEDYVYVNRSGRPVGWVATNKIMGNGYLLELPVCRNFTYEITQRDATTPAILTLSPENATIGRNGGERTFTVSANHDWTWESSAEWLTSNEAINQSSIADFPNATDTLFTYLVGDNPDPILRTAVITITAGDISQTHTVTQSPGSAGRLALSPTTVTIPAAGGANTFAVSSNTNWNWDTNASWVTSREPITQSGDQEFSYSVEPNTSPSPRNASITLRTSSGRNIVRSYRVTQESVEPGTLSISPNSISLAAVGGIRNFAISSNAAWSWSTDSSWITSRESTAQSGDQEFSYSIEPNTTLTQRSGTIFISTGDIVRTHVVSQDGFAENVDAVASGLGEETLTFEINVDDGVRWTAESLVDWVSIIGGANGIGSGIVSYRVHRNSSENEREGDILVTILASETSYQVVEGGFNWSQARADAESRGGQLAVLDTMAKINAANSYLDSILRWPDIWIGLTDQAREGEWRWISGAPLTESLWNDREPSDSGGVEEFVIIHGYTHPNRFSWNDTSIGGAGSYLLETGENESFIRHTVWQPPINTTADTDGDGALDIHETDTGSFVNASNTGTDPRNADTDGDGHGDSEEIAAGSDPTDSSSVPNLPPASIRLELEGAQVGPVVYRIDLRFLSGTGKTYRIERSGNLREWEAVESDISGNNLHIERTYFFNRVNQPRLFVRVLEE